MLHTLWRVDTKQGRYAIKELSPDIDLQNAQIIHNYELTEQIATTFSQHSIPAIAAMVHARKYLTLLEGKGFLVYPWVEGKALSSDQVTSTHAIKIARLLANMHRIHLAIPELAEPELPVHGNDELLELIHLATLHNAPFAKALQQSAQVLVVCNEKYQQAITPLKIQVVVSHGDLDVKNVLWNAHDEPILIDWESARLLNATYEMVNAAFDWSGITTEFDSARFKEMLNAYEQAGGTIKVSLLNAACYGVLGNWLHWLVYNIKRAESSEVAQKSLGIEQVNMVLPMMLRLQQFIPELIKDLK